MTYNIHPLFVHFPIALLLLYSAVKILPMQKWFPKGNWKTTEILLLVTGLIGAFIANSTGELAEELVRPNGQLVEMHAFFAAATTWMYGIILAGEVLRFINSRYTAKLNSPVILKIATGAESILTNTLLTKLLAFVGLITISVTGLLGGVMVYGVSADPIAPMVLKLLGITF